MIFYRLLMALALPVLLVLTLWQRLTGRVPPGALAERLGLVAQRTGPVLWLHGASLGEVTSARWVIAGLLAAHPGLSVLVTCNTATARALVAGWGLPGVVAALAPLDSGGAAARLIRRVRPRALIVVENEMWPARLQAARKAGVPVIVIGARMSERSFARWMRAPRLIGWVLGHLDHVSAQDGASAARLRALGLPADRLGPMINLKSRVAVAVLPQDEPRTDDPLPRSRVLLAASTHEGEDGPVLDAFVAARAAGVFDRLILAPRHPGRAPAIAALIAARGLGYSQRSAGGAPDANPVHLADTTGEMARWYDMAGATVIGGTFADTGGHTPWEPAAAGSAILHGPSVWNHRDAFEALDAGGAAIALPEITGLAAALRGLDAAAQERLARAARTVLAPQEVDDGLIRTIATMAGLTG